MKLITSIDNLISRTKLNNFFYGFWVFLLSFMVLNVFIEKVVSIVLSMLIIIAVFFIKDALLTLEEKEHKNEVSDILFSLLPGIGICLIAYQDSIINVLIKQIIVLFN